MINTVPGFALDGFTREGRQAFGRFLETDAATADWIRQHLPVAGRVEFLAQLVFRVEGGVLLERMAGETGRALRERYTFDCLGLSREAAREVLALMRAEIPRLNGIRADVMEGQSHA